MAKKVSLPETKTLQKTLSRMIFFILALSLLTQCGIYRKTDARKVPGNVNDRVQKNLEEGKRIRFGGGKGSGSGNFSFATSNEMWRATIEILDFIPLKNKYKANIP